MALAQKSIYTNFKRSMRSDDDEGGADADDDEEWYDDVVVDDDEDDFIPELDKDGEPRAPRRRVSGTREQRNTEMEIRRQMLETKNWITGGQPRPTQFNTVDEDTEQHFDYLQHIGLAAQDGFVTEVEMLIRDMESANLAIGPRTYHGLVFSHLEAGNINAALKIFHQEYLSGLVPLLETFHALIRAILKTRRSPEQAAMLYNECAIHHKTKIQPLWSTMVMLLMDIGCGDDAEYEFEAGLRRRLKPSHKMYEGIILELSSRGNLEDTRKAIYWLQHMRDNGLFTTVRHIRPVILSSCFIGDGISALELYLSMGEEGIAPPTAVETSIIFDNGDKTIFQETSTIPLVFEKAAKFDAWPRRESYALGLEECPRGAPLVDYLQCMVSQYPDILEAGLVEDDVILDILNSCRGTMGNTALTLHILHAMAEMHVTMPLQVMYPSRGSGTTLLTGPLAAIQTETAAEMEEMQEAAEEEEYVPPATQQVEGFGIRATVGVGECLVDDLGNVVAPSNMTMKMMQLELSERGLETGGKRAEVYARLQEAREDSANSVDRYKKYQREEKKAERLAEEAKGMKALVDKTPEWDIPLTMKIKHFKFDEVGEPKCYFVESKSVGDLIREYYVTVQTRRAWGLGRPGDTKIGGTKKKKVDLNSDADWQRPEGMSDDELRQRLWEHARDKEGMDPAFYRSMLTLENPAPPELEALTHEDPDGTITNVNLGEDDSAGPVPREIIREKFERAIQDSLDLMEAAEAIEFFPTVEDVLEVTKSATKHELQTFFDKIVDLMQRNAHAQYDMADVAEVFEMLVLSALYTSFDQPRASSFYYQMLDCGVPESDGVLALKEIIDNFDPAEARRQAEEYAAMGAAIKQAPRPKIM